MRKSSALLLVFCLLITSQTIITNPQFTFAESNENSWEPKASMHEARYNLGVAVVNGKIYAIGGDAGSGTGDQGGFHFFGYRNFSAINEEYNPATNT